MQSLADWGAFRRVEGTYAEFLKRAYGEQAMRTMEAYLALVAPLPCVRCAEPAEMLLIAPPGRRVPPLVACSSSHLLSLLRRLAGEEE